MRAVIFAGSILLAACSQPSSPAAQAPVAAVQVVPKGDPVEGLRVATRVGCNGCHTKDGRGGGMDISTPEGDRIVASNLTKVRDKYDDAGLAALLREGKTHDGHRAFGMPIFMFQHLSDQEVRDITAWLRGLPEVENPGLAQGKVSATTLQQIKDGTFPYDNDDKPDPGNVPPAIRPTEPLALGRYIAMTSCTECHGRDLNGWGEGQPPSMLVAKAYTPEHFKRLLRTGIAATGKDTSDNPLNMSDIARSRYAQLTDVEIDALKQYLDSR